MQDPDTFFAGEYIGKRNIGIGVGLGFSYLLRPNIVLNLGFKQIFEYDEFLPNQFEFYTGNGAFVFKLGYRFGGEKNADEPIE